MVSSSAVVVFVSFLVPDVPAVNAQRRGLDDRAEHWCRDQDAGAAPEHLLFCLLSMVAQDGSSASAAAMM